ncbi:MAG: hypothetical protein H7070_14385 [Saprospiraceae bacterium]|nr:hypothetical protein [Pyrinomonadaceae bacterium]
MRKRLLNIFTLSVAAVAIFAANTAFAQNTSPRATNRQIQTLLTRIETKTDTFKREMDYALDRTPIAGTSAEDRYSDFIGDFETATDALRAGFSSRQDVSSEVSEVLNRSMFINRFMTRNRVSTRAQSQWTSLRTDLNTLATYYRLSWNWNQQMPMPNPTYPAYTATDIQLRNLLTRIENRTDVFKGQVNTALDRGRLNNTNREDNFNTVVTEFENATDRLKQKFDDRESAGSDASEVLTRAQYIDRFMTNNRLTASSQTQWSNLKTDLNTLAGYYRVSWNWNQTMPIDPIGSYPAFDSRITGTYRLNTGLSDNVTAVIDRSLSYYTTEQRDNVRRNLERRLNSPEMIAIEKNRQTVTLASTNSQQATFEADGVAKTETNPRGRTITTTATANNNGIDISYVGERSNDFYVTFAPSGNGQLKVTRRIYLENRNDQVTVSSVYDKVNNSAQWSTVNPGGGNNNVGTGNVNDFYIPNGVKLTGTLNNAVDTKVSQVGDRFSLDVTSPSQYRGAVIEGHIGSVSSSGRVSGRANVSMEFDTIRLANGRSYRFAGLIDSVRAVNGDNVTVSNEGTVRDGSQTTKTITRAGIGAVLGAIIGAVAGGGQGAAIGAGVGAGAGAGSVLITGRDSIQLAQGSELMITSAAPGSVGVNR